MYKYEVPPYLRFNVEKTAEALSNYIKAQVNKANAAGVIFGLSGGVDSAVVAALAIKALGSDKVFALIMPEVESNPEDVDDAIRLTKLLGIIKVRYIDITNIVSEFLKAVDTDYQNVPKLPKGNVKARTRMILLYYFANTYNLIVLGTSNRSEYLIGFFTKWGDGAADAYPIIRLYKTQVRLLAEYLGIPDRIAWKPSSPGLWRGHRASDELGAEYDVIDKILYHLVDLGLKPEEVAMRVNIPINFITSIVRRMELTKHKREFPELPPPPIT